MIGTEQGCREGRNDPPRAAGPTRDTCRKIQRRQSGPWHCFQPPDRKLGLHRACYNHAWRNHACRNYARRKYADTVPSSAMQMAAESALLANSRTSAPPSSAPPSSAHSSSYAPALRAMVRVGQRTQSANGRRFFSQTRPGDPRQRKRAEWQVPLARSHHGAEEEREFERTRNNPRPQTGRHIDQHVDCKIRMARDRACMSRPSPVCTIDSDMPIRTVLRVVGQPRPWLHLSKRPLITSCITFSVAAARPTPPNRATPKEDFKAAQVCVARSRTRQILCN